MQDTYDWPHLLSLAVHELRTPASVVAGYLRMLERDTNNPLADPHRKLVGEAARSCTRLIALIAELSELSKLDAGTLVLAHQRFDLFEQLGEVAEGVQEGRDRGVRVDLLGQATGAPMAGDRARVCAAIGVVLRAVAREQPGSCTVVIDRRRSSRGGEMNSAVVVIGLEDSVQAAYESPSGPFDEFRGGLGLALPIARRVIELHGGRMWSPAGDGSRAAALISLPLSE
jgi:signal transduction histidine kinase